MRRKEQAELLGEILKVLSSPEKLGLYRVNYGRARKKCRPREMIKMVSERPI